MDLSIRRRAVGTDQDRGPRTIVPITLANSKPPAEDSFWRSKMSFVCLVQIEQHHQICQGLKQPERDPRTFQWSALLTRDTCLDRTAQESELRQSRCASPCRWKKVKNKFGLQGQLLMTARARLRGSLAPSDCYCCCWWWWWRWWVVVGFFVVVCLLICSCLCLFLFES